VYGALTALIGTVENDQLTAAASGLVAIMIKVILGSVSRYSRGVSEIRFSA
jgi:hypothetical protein